MRISVYGVVGMTVAMAGQAWAQHDHADDFTIARTSGGQLAVEFENPDEPLGRLDVTAFNGWFADEPGFRNIDEDEPDEDLYMLDPSSFIQIEIVGIGAGGFSVLPPDFDIGADDFDASKLLPGSTFDLGAPDFDDHPFWVVSDTDWDGVSTTFDLEFRVLDTGSSAYAPSEVYTATFFIPSPGVLACVGLGACGLVRRRR